MLLSPSVIIEAFTFCAVRFWVYMVYSNGIKFIKIYAVSSFTLTITTYTLINSPLPLPFLALLPLAGSGPKFPLSCVFPWELYSSQL